MPTSLIRPSPTLTRIVLCCALISVPFSDARSAGTGLSADLIQEALGTIDLIVGKDLSADDQAWLRQQWTTDAANQPESTGARLEALAIARRRIEIDKSPVELAQMRTGTIDETYCAAQQTSDPTMHRFQAIVAPPDLVLTADCVTGVVVTPFDVAALARSNAMVGDLVGSPVDAGAIEAELLQTVPDIFDGLTLEQQQRLLWAELRASALDMVWASVDEVTRQKLTAIAQENFNQNGDVATAALGLEKAAFKQLGELTIMARAGDKVLRPSVIATYVAWLELAGGLRFSPSEHAEITDMIVADFHQDPETTINNAAGLQRWMDGNYHFGKDPATGELRSWTTDEQMRMRGEQAAQIFCYSQSTGDPDDQRLIEIVFADNPVTDDDCANGSVTRESDRVLAELGDHKLTRGMLDAHRRAFEVIFAFQFSPDERRWFDDLFVATMREDPETLMRSVGELRQLTAKIEGDTGVGPHLNQQYREDIAIQVYCANNETDDPDVARLFDLINAHDPIMFEDCNRQFVVRDSDVDGLVASLNFIASLGDFPSVTQDERRNMRELLAPAFNRGSSGSMRYLSTWATFSYWWSRMPIEVRHKTALTVRQEVGSAGEIGTYSNTLSRRAMKQITNLILCDHYKEQLFFQTEMASLWSRAIIDTSSNPLASPWVNPGSALDELHLYDTLAPFVRAQCEKVWN